MSTTALNESNTFTGRLWEPLAVAVQRSNADTFRRQQSALVSVWRGAIAVNKKKKVNFKTI
jgi:hypothetical protein